MCTEHLFFTKFKLIYIKTLLNGTRNFAEIYGNEDIK